jgi:hypothetical protein
MRTTAIIKTPRVQPIAIPTLAPVLSECDDELVESDVDEGDSVDNIGIVTSEPETVAMM